MVKYFREEGNLSDTISLINEDIGFFRKMKLGIVDSVLLNTDINVFVFSFILDVFFLITGHPLCLSIETILLYGIFPFLLNIFKSFTEKFSSLMSCLLFTYLILYVYNYITIFYMRDVFILNDDPMIYDSEVYAYEQVMEQEQGVVLEMFYLLFHIDMIQKCFYLDFFMI